MNDSGTINAILEDLRDLAAAQGFAVHAYCFMPDHLHFLIEGLTQQSDMRGFMVRFKQRTAFKHQRRFSERLWHYNYYDHILRSGDAMDGIAWYIWMNPVRKGLCRDAHDFPHSGSFTIPRKTTPRPEQVWIPPWKKSTKPT